MKRRAKSAEPRTWGIGGDPSAAGAQLGYSREHVKAAERELECEVSKYVGAMPFLFVAVEDDPGPGSARGLIERNAIALLSNYGRTAIDPPSKSWLGCWSGRERVRVSGLWNNNHVDETFDAMFLDLLSKTAEATSPLTAVEA